VTGRRGFTLPDAIRRLRRHYGRPAPPATTDPFELILVENVAYLASIEERRAAFEQLERTVGTSPRALLQASRKALEGVTSKGILREKFADKLRECARIALERFDGTLAPVLDGPPAAAVRALRSFPGIGEPGAEKILLFSGRRAVLAPESNGLRVLARLGFVPNQRSYSRAYAADPCPLADRCPSARPTSPARTIRRARAGPAPRG
jgi:endonuclease-3